MRPVKSICFSTVRWAVFGLTCLMLFACQACAPQFGKPLAVFSGKGETHIALSEVQGPVVLHITAGAGKLPFQLQLSSNLKVEDLVSAAGEVDEIRGGEVAAGQNPSLLIQGDRTWTVNVYPANPQQFVHLKIPGKFNAAGNAVFFLDGEYGVATFDAGRNQDFQAWAFGPGGVAEELYITPDGDYKGKSVLPRGAGWIIVSARERWSVDIQAPCCKAPPGFK